MTDIPPLSSSYAAARAAFLTAAAMAGATVTPFPHPLTGLDDEELSIDVADLGPREASKLVLVVSATHGVEGYCGSALQRHWLAEYAHQRPANVRVVMMHALNPYGFSWVRRVNEDNIDLNRNFIDWAAPPPESPDYAQIADLLVPLQWTDEEQKRTTEGLLEFAVEHGFPRLQAAVSGGQYSWPTGLFYGGSGPSWSHRWLDNWCVRNLRAVGTLTIIDLHTGLGPWGHGELIASAPSHHPVYQRAAKLWGAITSVADGDSVSAQVSGDWVNVAEQLAPRGIVTPICLEFGTVDPLTVVAALRADAWLHAHGDPLGAQAPSIRAQVRAAFADDDPAWLTACWNRFTEVIGPALLA